MLPATKREIKRNIQEAKKAGKDVSDLEAFLSKKGKLPPCEEVGPVEKRIGGYMYVSTGPLTVDDFGKNKKKTKKKKK